MTFANSNRPRIGIPWRTSGEEAAQNRPKIANYENAIRQAGAEPVLLSLKAQEALPTQLEGLQGFVLPGSPADVAPAGYGAADKGLAAPADLPREQTDRAILEHAFAENKPVLAICFGCQLLNVYLGGTLLQDVRTETGTQMAHCKKDLESGVPIHPPSERHSDGDPLHTVRFEGNSKLSALSHGTDAKINSSHHQSIEKPGRHLQVTGVAPDGIIESVEWTGGPQWVVGVQWHPERMPDDPLAQSLFADFVAAARAASNVPAGKP